MKPEDKKYILENAGKKSIEEIARRLKLKEKKVRNFLQQRAEMAAAPQRAKEALRAAAIILIIAAGLLVYFNTFGNDFVWDDDILIIRNEFIRDWQHLKEIFTKDVHYFGDRSNFYRPLQNLTYAIDYTFWGLDPKGYHITNAVIHTINAVLIYFFIFSITIIQKGDSIANPSAVALSSAILWAVHPVHTQCVSYVSGRADLLAGFFIVFSCYAYIKLRNKSASLILFIFALMSKETAVITPLLVCLCAYYAGPSGKKSAPYSAAAYSVAPYFAIAVVYIALKFTILHFPDAPFIDIRAPLYSRLLTSARAVMILFGILLAPFHLSMTRNIPWENTAFNPKVFFSILGLAMLLIYAFKARKRMPSISFGIFWFFIAYLPYANIFPINANVSEHWMYLPSIGLFLAFSVFFVEKLPTQFLHKEKLPLGPLRVRMAIVAFFVIYFGTFTVMRNFDWKNEVTFYNKTLSSAVKSARVHANLGNAYGRENKYKEAIEHYKKAIEMDPKYAEPYANMGLIYFRMGKLDEAIALYEKAKVLKDDLTENHSNLGIAYFSKGMLGEAEAEFERTLELSPNHLVAMNGLGLICAQRGRYEEAKNYFQEVIGKDPSNLDAYSNMGMVYSRLSMHKDAAKMYQKAIEIDPGRAETYNNLAITYYNDGQYDLAVKYCDKAAGLGYKNAELSERLKPYRRQGG